MEIADHLMIRCAQCCRKHLSAAIAHYALASEGEPVTAWRILFKRALVNLCEADEGYKSHLPFAVGLIVMAEEECGDKATREELRRFRLSVCDGERSAPSPFITPGMADGFLAHVAEAEREFPEIRDVVSRDRFYRNNMSESEVRQAEIDFRLAQLKWLDDNIFGLKPAEKGEEQMACCKKAKPAAKKAACKGGCTKKVGCKKGK